MAVITRTSSREVEQMRRSALGSDQGPTEEQQAGGPMPGFIRRGRFDPQDPTNVSFPFLHRIRRDHMVGMGLHFIRMDALSAPWWVDGDDARVQAYADKLIRPIYGDLFLIWSRSMEFGYSPGSRNFKTVRPNWKYYEDGVAKTVWDNGDVDAIVYSAIEPLEPETAQIVWDKKGRFLGIQYDVRYGTASSFIIDGIRKPNIDKLHCSPPDERVLTTNRGYVPIGELDEETDKLVVWMKKQKQVWGRRKGYSFKKGSRPYSGPLLTIKTDGSSTRVTPNHKLTIRWRPDEARGKWVVYLMRKGDWWRIGISTLLSEAKSTTGIRLRMSAENADEGWILGVFDSRNEAAYHEALWKNQYAVPDMCFQRPWDKESPGNLTTGQLEEIWSQVDSKTGALRLLEAKGLDSGYPIFVNSNGSGKVNTGTKGWTIAAANAIPELMEIPVDPGQGLVADWMPITSVDKEHYEGEVFSLEVPPHHHYISNGTIVQNSFWGTHDRIGSGGNPYGFPRIAYCAPIFWMYRWIWDLVARGFENSFDPGPVVRFPSEDPLRFNDEGATEPPVTRALRMGKLRRTGSTIALPSETYKDLQERATSIYKWGIEYPEMRTDFSSVLEFIGYLEATKLNALFLPEQSLTEGRGSSSSRNVAENFSDQRSASQNNMLSQFHRWVVDVFVAPVIAMVFPWYEGELEIKSIGAGSAANDLLRQVFQLVGQQEFKRFGIDMRRLAEANGFPMLDPEEQQRELERQQQEAAQIAATKQTPEVEPTQGRRSLVTQTGFGETVYHQLHPPIALSRDGDFVASLPRVDAFSDATVVAHARELRGAIERLANWAYGDFALAISKRKEMLSDDASATLRQWVPDMSKAEAHAQAIRRSLAKLYARTADQTIKGLGGKSRVVPADEYLDTRTIQVVGDTVAAVRDDLAGVVEHGIELEHDGRAIAAEVRHASNMSSATASSWLARLGAQRAYTEAVIEAGEANLVKHALLVDGCCAQRHGKIINLDRVYDQIEYKPGCSLTVRLLPKAPDDLEIRHEELEDGAGAMYDEETSTILVSPRVKQEDEAAFMVALAGRFR